MQRKPVARTLKSVVPILCVAAVPAAAQDADRERGSYSSYGSYNVPISRPTHRLPARDGGGDRAVAQAADAAPDSPPRAVPPSAHDMVGRALVDGNGERLGEVRAVVRDRQDQTLKAVVHSGGFMGVGEKEVVVPLERLQLRQHPQQGQVVVSDGLDRNQLQQMAGYQADRFDPVDAPQG